MRRATCRAIAAASTATAAASSAAACGAAPSEANYEEHARRWTIEENRPGYQPPSASWPRSQPRLSRVPAYRSALAECGSVDVPACHGVAFTLAAALLGGALFGHAEHADESEPTRAQEQEGIELLHALAARGCADGSCGLGFCLLDGPGGLERDERRAALVFEQAALMGHAQAMCELATMFYLGDGVPVDEPLALTWFRRSAEAGVPAAQYLYGEFLLEGRACEADAAQAFAWFARAGGLGHRGARSRIITAVSARARDGEHAALEQEYGQAAGRRAERWVPSG